MRFLNRNRRKILFSLVVCVCVMIFVDQFFKFKFFDGIACNFVLPIEKFFIGVFDWSHKKIVFLDNIFEIENENIKLKEEADKYNLERQKYKIIEQENKKLNELLELKNKFIDFDSTGAYVIAKDSCGYFDIFLIDKGINDGIKNNMVIMADNGLVGKIIDCKKCYSKVLSILDEKNSVSIKNSRTNDLGFVKGNIKLKNKGLCLVEFLDDNAELIEGDEIITSHLSKIYPEGLSVGQIKNINIKKNEREIILEPTCDFKNIEHVLIIKQQKDKKIVDEVKDNNFESGE